jgi:hypothetical protein
MKYLPGGALLSAIGLSFSLQAATEFPNGLAPIELLQEFSGGNVYRSLPDNFPTVPLPAGLGLSVIGSLERGSSQQQVLLRNAGTGEAVLAALLTAYSAAGWIDLPHDLNSLNLCHDQLGQMTIRSSDAIAGEHRLYVTRTRLPPGYPYPGGLTCEQQQSGSSTAIFTWIMTLMPVLEVPEGTMAPGFPVAPFTRLSSFFGNGSTGFDASQEGAIEVPDTTLAELHEHFVLQLEEQGWVADSNASGTRSSSSVWYKTAQSFVTDTSPAEDIELTGIMSILHTEDDTYRILFRTQTGTSAFGVISGFSSFGNLGAPALGIRGIPIGFSEFVRDPLN